MNNGADTARMTSTASSTNPIIALLFLAKRWQMAASWLRFLYCCVWAGVCFFMDHTFAFFILTYWLFNRGSM